MLKLKNNVDVKVLEDFGFSLNSRNNYEYKKFRPVKSAFEFDYVWYIEFREMSSGYVMFVHIINNDFSFENDFYDLSELYDLIFDLSSSGILEKDI